MAQWSEAVNISGLHRLYETGGIGLQQLAKGVVRRLQNTEAFAISDPELTEIICMFGHIDEFARLKDYNTVLETLYDFGNKDNRLWVEVEGPQEFDDIPPKIRNQFEEDTKPQFTHGSSKPFKAPHVRGDEWVMQPIPTPVVTPTRSYYGHITGCTCDLCLKEHARAAENDSIEEWDCKKTYTVGDLVRHKNMKYECLISCLNSDPHVNSYNKPSDSWKWVSSVLAKPLDPTLVFTNRITCETRGKPYPTGRKFKYMSDDEFRKKLNAAEIDPPTIPKDLYNYWKDSEEPYQDWLIEKWNKGNLTFRAQP